tara:strand:- start:1436 stop:1771 length:336 start_codon:yes stop_codon:yes gene_type:complete
MAPITREEFFDFHKAFCDEALALSQKKNADYAGSDGKRPFANFQRVEDMGVCSTEKGFLVRMVDKLSRLSSFSDSGKFEVKDEGVRDTLIDVVNYACLLAAYIEAKNNGRL